MPYVKDNTLSSSPISGGIEISYAEQDALIAAKAEGKRISTSTGEIRVLSAADRTVYSTTDGSALAVPEDETTPDGFTDLAPGSPDDIWDGAAWVAPLPTEDSVKRATTAAVNAVAVAKGYDSAQTIATYVSSTNALWRAEAAAFTQWRDGVWAYVYEQLALWSDGQRAIAADDTLFNETAAIVWPSATDYTPALVKQSVLSNIVVSNGDQADNIVSGSGVAGAWRQSTGIYWAFFAREEPDTNYIVNSYAGGAVRVYAPSEEKATGYCILRVEDETGTLVDPVQINIEIKRAV